MGLIGQVFAVLFGGGRNVVRDTVEVFHPNAEAQAKREFGLQGAALRQFAHEFQRPQKGWFDRLMDALNRVPRPAMALGTLGLFVAAMVDPVWFAARMTGIALVPEPLWWLLGAIVSFYFGARHQAKGQDFQRDIAIQMGEKLPGVLRRVEELESERQAAQPAVRGGNAALEEWRRRKGA